MSIKGTAAVFVSLSALTLAAVLAGACAINPQPLPPETNDGSINVDGGGTGNFGGQDEDGATATPSSNGDADAGGAGGSKDSGDGGDAGDGSSDAAITDAGDGGD